MTSLKCHIYYKKYDAGKVYIIFDVKYMELEEQTEILETFDALF